jgi:hypothetical protein
VRTGTTLDVMVTLTNSSAAGAPLAGPLRVGAPFTLVSTTCAPTAPATLFVLQPGQSCTARVKAVPAKAGDIAADIAFPVAGEPAVDLVARVRVTVTTPPTTAPPSAASTTTTTTTTPVAPTSQAERQLPTGTVPRTIPTYTFPRYNRSSSYYSDYYSGGSYYSTESSSATFETLGASAGVFDPASFEFAPTIVGAGSRTATLTLVNPGFEDLAVSAVSIDAAGAASSFTIAADTCTGAVLPGGAQCTVDITFAPAETGELAATVVASFADGTTAQAQVTGLAADEPVLRVVPDVAATGQVVSLIGAGFPAGATVEVRWNRGMSRTVEVSDVGDLRETMIVLPHTRRGPSRVTVIGQPDLFADVSARLLVSATAERPSTAALGNVSRPVRN